MKAYKLILAVAFCVFGLNVKAQQANAIQTSIIRGEMVYKQNCLTCHQADGSGVPNLTPPLIKTIFVSGDKTRLINVLLKGLKDTEVNGESYENPMPPFQSLSDQEVADVLTYIRSHFSNKASGVKPEEVGRARKSNAH